MHLVQQVQFCNTFKPTGCSKNTSRLFCAIYQYVKILRNSHVYESDCGLLKVCLHVYENSKHSRRLVQCIIIKTSVFLHFSVLEKAEYRSWYN